MQTTKWIAIVAISYVAVFAFEAKVVFPVESYFLPEEVGIASVIFLPHAARVLSTVVVGPKAFFALFPAMLFVDYFMSATVSGNISPLFFLVSIIGAGCAPLAYYLVMFARRKSSRGETDLQDWRLVLEIGVVASLLNSVGRSIAYDTFFDIQNVVIVAARVIIGDIVGLMAGLYILLFIFRIFHRNSMSNM